MFGASGHITIKAFLLPTYATEDSPINTPFRPDHYNQIFMGDSLNATPDITKPRHKPVFMLRSAHSTASVNPTEITQFQNSVFVTSWVIQGDYRGYTPNNILSIVQSELEGKIRPFYRKLVKNIYTELHGLNEKPENIQKVIEIAYSSYNDWLSNIDEVKRIKNFNDNLKNVRSGKPAILNDTHYKMVIGTLDTTPTRPKGRAGSPPKNSSVTPQQEEPQPVTAPPAAAKSWHGFWGGKRTKSRRGKKAKQTHRKKLSKRRR